MPAAGVIDELRPAGAVEAAFQAPQRRFAAIALPELLNELACQRASLEARSWGEAPNGGSQRARSQPLAVVLTESEESAWDASTRLDAVNGAARERGVRVRQTIAEASALAANLKVLALQRSHICAALKQIAEVALGFGAPVSFDELGTVWVDITGSCHLFGTEEQLATQLVSSIRALGHDVRVAIADGPWVAKAVGHHAATGESDVLVVPSNETVRAVSALPILSLPIGSETIAWFAQLGLLFIDDLKKLPSAAIAARIPGGIAGSASGARPMFESTRPMPKSSPMPKSNGPAVPGVQLGSVLDLIRGADDSVLIPYHPEEMPREESSWDDPLDNVEPLLFVTKGLAGRLGSRLEGRGQAAQELLLTIQYDRSLAALQSAATGREIATSHEVHFRLATPLMHADDIERVVRSRLQREVLAAPATGLSLCATCVTRAQSSQLGLCSALRLSSDISPEARRIAVLVAELVADVGSDAVGVLAMGDSHLLEKSSRLVPIGSIANSEAVSPVTFPSPPLPNGGSSSVDFTIDPSIDLPIDPAIATLGSGFGGSGFGGSGIGGSGLASLRPPTRLLVAPLELTGPIELDELWMLGQQPFVVKDIRFEERLELVEWWENAPIERDYFRVWVSSVERNRRADRGVEVLAYFDRESGKSYVQAVYD